MEQMENFGRSGQPADVDQLMIILLEQNDIVVTKIIDYALSLVQTETGMERIRFYLLHGEPIQRNYAALFFKRLGREEILARAVALGKIDTIQGFAR
jgi:hypothetical protein